MLKVKFGYPSLVKLIMLGSAVVIDYNSNIKFTIISTFLLLP